MLKAKHKPICESRYAQITTIKKGTTYVIPFFGALEDSLAS